MTRKMRSRLRASYNDLIHAAANVFRLSGTARAILKVLSRAKQALSVEDIAGRVRRSERAVRTHLMSLVKRGILIRKVIVTKNKKLAYKYTLGPIEKIITSLKTEISRQLRNLEAIEKGLRSKINPARQ
jgi:predicted DNA-binding transcriptional regulator